MRVNKLIIAAFGVSMLMACKKEGCTDQTAMNYDSKAKNDDGSCVYDTNNPGGPGGGTTGPNGETLPIRLTGTESNPIIIKDMSTNPNVADYYIDNVWKAGAAVTIEPGVNIEMRSGARIEVESNGSLNATGTASNKINIKGAQDQVGYWNDIIIASNDPNNKLIHCNISNGSSSYSFSPAMIGITDNAQVTVQNSSFSKGSEYGLMTRGNDATLPNFKSNTFDYFVKAPISLNSLHHTNFLDNTTTILSNNTVQRIYIQGGDVELNTSVPKLNVPYSVRGGIDFKNSQTIIKEGVELRMAENTKFVVKDNASLRFNGTAANPILMTGELSSKGYWYQIIYGTNSPENVISYTTISGGRNAYSFSPGLVHISDNAQVSMDNSHLKNSKTPAVDGDASATFNDNLGNDWDDCDGGGGLLP